MTSLFNYSDYKAYLNAYLKQLPKQGHGEARKIAKHLGVSSTFVSQVLSNLRDLNLEHTELLSEYLGLSALEGDYLFHLVLFERAGSVRLKRYLEKKIKALREQSLQLMNRLDVKKILSDADKAIFYSSAIYSAIHLYSSTGKNGRSLEEIMNRFELTRARATEVLRFLKDCGLILESEKKFQMSTQSTYLSQDSPHLIKHHSNWRIKAIQTAEVLDSKELMYTGQVSLSEKDFEILREDMASLIKRFLERVHASPAEEIACLNIDWFWVRK